MVSFYYFHHDIRRWDFNWPWPKGSAPEFKKFIHEIYSKSFNWEPIYPRSNSYDDTLCPYYQKIPLRVSSSLRWVLDEKGSILADFIGKFENLQCDFNSICEKIGIPPSKLSHVKKSSQFRKYKHYTEHYDDETRELVAEAYKDDIDRLGYKFGE